MLKQRTEKPHLKIELGDERRCNLDDDESFEERKGGRNAMRKSSINITPKSRVIEPGKIFNSRQMTPSQVAGKRKKEGSMIFSAFYPRKSSGETVNSHLN
jgi:hypothetical protein